MNGIERRLNGCPGALKTGFEGVKVRWPKDEFRLMCTFVYVLIIQAIGGLCLGGIVFDNVAKEG